MNEKRLLLYPATALNQHKKRPEQYAQDKSSQSMGIPSLFKSCTFKLMNGIKNTT